MQLSAPKFNTFVIPVIRPDLIERCLETIYAHTPDNFYVYVIDQTMDGLDYKLRDKYQNLMFIRTPRTETHKHGNLGFAQGTNLGIKLVQTPYFTMCNDDVEFIDRRWWQTVLETFELVESQTPDRPAMMVNPSSIKLPDWSIGRPKGDHLDIIPYKKDYTPEDWNHLVNDEHYVNEHLTLKPGSVIDGVTMYCSVFDTRKFLEVGYLPEQLYPGGGEDYWYNALANMSNYRCVGTTKSWVYHHWSMTMSQTESDKIKKLIDQDLKHNNNHEDWGPDFDVWGYKCKECGSVMLIDRDYDNIARCPNHPDQTYEIPESKTMPL